MDKVIATGARWYVLQTQPHAENRAIANLERQGFHVFCPRIRKTVRHARAVKQVFSPLFPGYVFLERDIAIESWRSVNGTFGVMRLITQGEAPQPVPHGIVEALQSRMGGDGAMNWAPSFKIGQAIRITEGPFTDLIGTLEQLDASGRVRVLLDLLGRAVSVALRQEALAPAA
ncbi:MAG: transcriptional activator RfaH [Rhizomicrobium sp.]